jgi:vacuolar-type H+-ATPase subunit H
MELIKKIKQAETQAQEIIEQAKAQAAAQAEEGRQRRLESLTQAEHDRRKSVEAAVAEAQSQGLVEIENLKAQAEKKRQQLRNKVGKKTTPAVAKVMEYLKKG